MKSVILSEKETQQVVLDMARKELIARYPNLSERALDKLARKLMRKSIKQLPGKTMRLDLKPKNLWEALKDKFMPAKLRDRFPVRYTRVQ